VSVGIVAKRDDSVIGDEDGAALSGHRQEDPSNRFLLSVGPSHASDATVYMEHAISTATLAEKSDVQRPNPNATMLQTRMPNPNDVYTLRSSRADRYPVPMDAMDNSDVRLYFDMHRTTDQSLTSSVTGTMNCSCTSVPLVWSTASAQGTLQCRSCKNGDGALASLPAGCSGALASFFEEFYFSIFGTRLRADH